MNNELERLFAEVNATRRAWSVANATIARKLAPDFNMFDFLRKDELGLSSILAWLLDPRGSHGQADDFLRLFLTHFKVQSGSAATAKAVATTEAPTSFIKNNRRRMDVRVRFDGFVLAIENKPWAGWQPSQVRDYLEQLSFEAPRGNCLVIIKGRVGDVSESQITKAEIEASPGRVNDTDYMALLKWLARCVDMCEAASVRAVLTDLSRYVEAEFGGGATGMKEDVVVAAILGNEFHRKAAFDVVASSEPLFEELGKRGMARLDAAIAGKRTRNEKAFNHNTDSAGPNLFLDANAPFTLALEFAEPRLSKPYIGLYTNDVSKGRRAPFPTICEALKRQGLAGYAEQYWIWWNWIDEMHIDHPDVSMPAATWEALANGQLIDFFLKVTDQIEGVLIKSNILPWKGSCPI